MPLDRAKVSEEAWAASDGGGPMVVTANRACGEPESQALRLSGSLSTWKRADWPRRCDVRFVERQKGTTVFSLLMYRPGC